MHLKVLVNKQRKKNFIGKKENFLFVLLEIRSLYFIGTVLSLLLPPSNKGNLTLFNSPCKEKWQELESNAENGWFKSLHSPSDITKVNN